MKWYQHDPDAFNSGTIQLTLEEIGAYILILNALYSRDGDLPNDDALLSRVLRVQPRTWRKIKSNLVAKGKIWVTADGKLMGKRVQNTLKTFREFSENQAKRAAKGWEKRKNPNERSGRAMPMPAMPGRNANTTTKKESLLPSSLTPSERASLATALPTGALARPPLEKPIHELTSAEVMERRRKKAAANGSLGEVAA